jgi:hypothetical protein
VAIRILAVLVIEHGEKVSVHNPVMMRPLCSIRMLIGGVKMESG